jgi:hypothetical protein
MLYGKSNEIDHRIIENLVLIKKRPPEK